MPRTVQVKSPAMPSLLGGPAFEVKSLTGREALGELFLYTIELQTPDSPQLTPTVTANVDVKKLVGKELSIIIELEGRGFQAHIGAGTREINGLVTSARFVRNENRRGIYMVTIEPWLVLATRTADCKIFQNQSALEIVQTVLTDYNYKTETRVGQTYPKLTYQTQFNETDHNFVCRLMQEYGIYHYFEHRNGIHSLILVDDAGAHQPFDSAAYQTINFYGETAKLDEEFVSQFESTEGLQSGSWATTDYDFQKPRARMLNTVRMARNTGHPDQEIFRYPGDYTDPDIGRSLARTRMEEAGAPGSRASGSGNLRAVVPGCTFKLQKYPQDKANIEYLVIGASLSIHESSHASGQQGYTCATQFQLQPANNIYRSPQSIPKPYYSGPQTAIVTGPAGAEIYVDEYSRIKVSFPWNRYCTKDENSSCWIRVVTPWAASNFGMIANPRVGTEVIVSFEGGDPDKPIVIGQVYNALNMPPWPLPSSAAQSGIKTRSTLDGAPGAGMKDGPGHANALRFDDRKDAEELWLHAQKNQLTEVENDEVKWVGNDRRKTIDRDEVSHIKRDRSEVVDNNEDITIHNNRTERVDHAECIDIGDSQTFKVGIDREKSIGRNESDTIGTKWSIDVGKLKTENIGIADILNVGVSRMMNIGGLYSQNIGMVMNTIVGMIQKAEIGLSKTTTVGSNYKLSVGGAGGASGGGGTSPAMGGPSNIVASSPSEAADSGGGGVATLEMDSEKIVLTIGKAKITLKFDGTLLIEGVDIQILGSDKITLKAKKIHEN